MMESLLSVSITGKMYGWTKWGGATQGLIKEELDEWYCQICGEKQIKTLPSYMFPMDCTQRDFSRVCTDCKAKAHVRHVVIFWDLLKIIKG
jgi:hypothetical protein